MSVTRRLQIEWRDGSFSEEFGCPVDLDLPATYFDSAFRYVGPDPGFELVVDLREVRSIRTWFASA